MTRASRFRSESSRAAYAAIYRRALDQSVVPVEEADVETSYGRTHVVTAGDPSKPALVALHAKGFSSTMWIPLLPTLVESHHVYLVDAVGDLTLSVATKVLSKPSHSTMWLGETLDALGLAEVSIVGASMGTSMAAH